MTGELAGVNAVWFRQKARHNGLKTVAGNWIIPLTVSYKRYKNTAQQKQAGNTGDTSGGAQEEAKKTSDEKVEDADYEVVDDDEKK